ncbi:ADP-ribose pyrophosphatase [Haematococcus lacustris]
MLQTIARNLSRQIGSPADKRALRGSVLQMAHTYQYPRPAVTTDCVIVAQPSPDRAAQLLLIRRKGEPYKGKWALPGGFVNEHEDLDTAAGRELQEETSVDPAQVTLTQVGTFGTPGRDPRGWTVTVAYAALVPSTDLGVKAADDAEEAQWFDVCALPALAFDHKLIVKTALNALAGRPETQKAAGALPSQLATAAAQLMEPWQEPA